MWAAGETATQSQVFTPPAGLPAARTEPGIQTCRDPVSHPSPGLTPDTGPALASPSQSSSS